jgi:hypothetical protein
LDLPHWDYPIRSSSIKPEVAARMKYDGALFADLFTIGGDAALGIVVAVALFNAQTPASYLLALGGACAGILPDALQFAYMRFPHQPLTCIQQFHEWIHTTRRMSKRPVLGITSQIALIIAFILAVQPLLAAQTPRNESHFRSLRRTVGDKVRCALRISRLSSTAETAAPAGLGCGLRLRPQGTPK